MDIPVSLVHLRPPQRSVLACCWSGECAPQPVCNRTRTSASTRQPSTNKHADATATAHQQHQQHHATDDDVPPSSCFVGRLRCVLALALYYEGCVRPCCSCARLVCVDPHTHSLTHSHVTFHHHRYHHIAARMQDTHDKHGEDNQGEERAQCARNRNAGHREAQTTRARTRRSTRSRPRD